MTAARRQRSVSRGRLPLPKRSRQRLRPSFALLAMAPDQWRGSAKVTLTTGIFPSDGPPLLAGVRLLYSGEANGGPGAVVIELSAPEVSWDPDHDRGVLLDALRASGRSAAAVDPVIQERFPLTVAGTEVEVVHHRFDDPRMARAWFRWRETLVNVASWRYPLDQQLFGGLSPVRLEDFERG